tara:strand:- start:41 stop:391 length:351 start_codon:yes stop_codon:yes gene_type:complete
MKQLSNKIRIYLDRTPDFGKEVILQDDVIGGVSNPYIKEWNISSEKAKPTDDQLNALESEATTLGNNNVIKGTRKTAYGNIGDQLDLLYKDMLADKGDKTGEWFKAVKKVKDDNPK